MEYIKFSQLEFCSYTEFRWRQLIKSRARVSGDERGKGVNERGERDRVT